MGSEMCIRDSIQGERGDAAFVGLGGTRVLFGEPERDLANETALRGFWKTWRGLMEL